LLTMLVERAEGGFESDRSIAGDGDQNDDVSDVERKHSKLASESARFELAPEAQVVEDAQAQLQVIVSDQGVVMGLLGVVDRHLQHLD